MAFNQFKFIRINSDWCLWQHLSSFEAKVPVLTFRWGPSQARSADVTIGNQLGIYKSRLLREYLAFNRTPEKVPSGVDSCWCIKSMDLKNLWYGSFSHIDSKRGQVISCHHSQIGWSHSKVFPLGRTFMRFGDGREMLGAWIHRKPAGKTATKNRGLWRLGQAAAD